MAWIWLPRFIYGGQPGILKKILQLVAKEVLRFLANDGVHTLVFLVFVLRLTSCLDYKLSKCLFYSCMNLFLGTLFHNRAIRVLLDRFFFNPCIFCFLS